MCVIAAAATTSTAIVTSFYILRFFKLMHVSCGSSDFALYLACFFLKLPTDERIKYTHVCVSVADK